MAGFLRAPVVLFVLTALLFACCGVQTASAQSAQESANAFARKISLMLTATPQAYPNAQMGGSVDFTYEGIACTRTTSNPDRGGVVTDSMTCRQTSPALTARCSTSTGLSFSCSVSDSAGNIIQIDGNGRFTPLVVGEDRVINPNGEQVGAVTGNPAPEGGSGNGCGMDALCWLGKLPGYLVSGLAYLLLVLSSLILWVAGSVFNWVVIRTVFQFATYFGTSEGMLIAWGVMRDIANIGLLFGFIFMGVATILNTQSMEGYSAKKALPRLIIFAVLLNFSLFATQGIIDVANGFASVFSSYAGEQCDSRTSDSQSAEACANVGISGKIAAAAGMNKLPSLGEAGDGIAGMLERPYTTATMLIILSLLVTITAMVLFAAAIMLVIRVVVLSLLMVTSPIGFAGMAIPALQKISKDWWDQLLNQSFFAPLYLLMVFISLKLVDGLQTGGASVGDAITGGSANGGTPAANMQVLVVYAVVIGFMVASLIVAKKMGATGAGFATNAASAVVYGTLARGANFGAGAAARGALALQRKTNMGGKTGNRIANTAFRFASTSNLDVRRVAGMGAVLGAAGVTSGAAPAAHATYADATHMASDFREGKTLKGLAAQADNDETMHQLSTAHGTDLSPELQNALTTMSVKELEQLHGIKAGVEGLAKNLTPEQFSKLMDKDSSLTNTEKGALQTARFAELQREADGIIDPATGVRAAPNSGAIKRILGNLGKSDLENLPADLLTNSSVMNNLSGKQREDLAGSNKRTSAERASMKASSKSGVFESKFNDPAAAGYGTAYDFVTNPIDGIRSLSAQDILKLPSAILTSDEVAVELTPAMLTALQDDNKLSAGDISEIGRKIRGTTASTSYGYVTAGAGIAYWS